MPKQKGDNFNFVADHMTILVQPQLYKLMYALFRIVLGIPKEGIIYEKRKRWPGASEESSLTFAACVGEVSKEKSSKIAKTNIAVVQPSEPLNQSSHVRTILDNHNSSAHWQHMALRTPDLLAFHKHALAHGMNFITPIMKDQDEDLLQIFTGELYLPGTQPTGIFFEFVQRDVTPKLLQKIASMDRQALFRDKTFLGLYGEKEAEYRSGHAEPILDHALMEKLQKPWENKNVWEITEKDLETAAETMRQYVLEKNRARSHKTPAVR